MPALSSREYEAAPHSVMLQPRAWQQTVGQSGMTPTAFAFLIPVFVVAVAAPFLCVFCIRKRRQPTRVTPLKKKKPAPLRRAEAREYLKTVTDVVDVSDVKPEDQKEGSEMVEQVETRSVFEKECAICLSTLHAPSPPEPALIANSTPDSETDAAALTPTPNPSDPSSTTASTTLSDATAVDEPSTEILKLSTCAHSFHAECLVSWFVLRKTSCPICRAVYYSKEAMQAIEDEEAAQMAAELAAVEPSAAQPVVRNWRYFLHGRDVLGRRPAVQGTAAGGQAGTELQTTSTTPATPTTQNQAERAV